MKLDEEDTVGADAANVLDKQLGVFAIFLHRMELRQKVRGNHVNDILPKRHDSIHVYLLETMKSK